MKSIYCIYLITDIKNGKTYVGSAYGKDSIWNRWKNYIEKDHGGNKKLIKLVQSEGKDYLTIFQFSLLEIFSKVTSKDEIIKKEVHWKNILLLSEFGFNDN